VRVDVKQGGKKSEGLIQQTAQFRGFDSLYLMMTAMKGSVVACLLFITPVAVL